MVSKDANKLDIVKLVKSETYPEENVLGKDGLNRYPYQPGEQDDLLTLSGIQRHIFIYMS